MSDSAAAVASPAARRGRSRRFAVVAGLSCAAAALLATAPAALLGEDPAPAQSASPMINHSVYFTLNESTPEGRAELVAACQKYLTDHEGTVYFAAGPRAEEFSREVNDQTFDVSLLVVFESKEAHDKYAVAPRHLEFIKEQKANWKTVRVFDSEVAPSK
ncbi:Dabb family protein [Alienimonas californiensis]|uniref:Stress responsive A/B Barrel Domain protein n=1 Tax=Alienimonas californiensis TaxID=2527989 RepID=A0A517PCD7_9PLAN|nr:Dabb family protein [Alienimonas californiensis]QDT17043.1 Stress responsive A/B Barrel Domain protein [Alienimonas californiensis]